MSKQSEAKERQGYTTDPKNCGSCKHFQCDLEEQKGYYYKPFYIERNKRCGLGGFAVKKTASCRLWEKKL